MSWYKKNKILSKAQLKHLRFEIRFIIWVCTKRIARKNSRLITQLSVRALFNLLFNLLCNTINWMIFFSYIGWLIFLQRTQIQLHIQFLSGQSSSGLVVLPGIEDTALHSAQLAHNCGPLRQYPDIVDSYLVLAGCEIWGSQVVLLGLRCWTLYLSVFRRYWYVVSWLAEFL
jgi:hypothetical protein